MTSYINQTIARQQVAELIAQAEHASLRRELRRARRARRTAGPGTPVAGPSPTSTRLRWGHRFGVAAVR